MGTIREQLGAASAELELALNTNAPDLEAKATRVRALTAAVKAGNTITDLRDREPAPWADNRGAASTGGGIRSGPNLGAPGWDFDPADLKALHEA